MPPPPLDRYTTALHRAYDELAERPDGRARFDAAFVACFGLQPNDHAALARVAALHPTLAQLLAYKLAAVFDALAADLDPPEDTDDFPAHPHPIGEA